MQLALRGKQFLIKRVAVLLMVLVVFCVPLIKPPVKVEAAVIPVVAGAAIVAAAMSALGIGVSAGFDTAALAEGAQKVWDDLSDSVRNTIVLTEIAGHTVAHFTEQALRDIFSGLQTAFPQASSGVVYSHPDSFTSRGDVISFLSNLGVSNAESLLFRASWGTDNILFISQSHRFNFSEMSNFRFVGSYSLPFSITGTDTYTMNVPWGLSLRFVNDSSGGIKLSGAIDSSGGIMTYPGTKHYISSDFAYHESASLPFGATFIALLFDRLGVTYTVFISVGLNDVYTFGTSSSLIDGAIPVPGQDVFNPANEKFYADGASVMSNSVDDVINRLKEGVGETGQISDQPDVITVPGQIVGNTVTDQTKGADQAGTIGKDIATPDDIVANDATNADRDTTKPTTPGEDTDIPDLSIPQIITNKFPFSIPWDLYNSVRILVAPAAAPKWVLPLRFDKLGVNTSITIDMAQFDGLAALSRWGSSLLFIISLIILSSKLVKR